MGTTADKLNRLLETKAALKSALVEKGQEPGDVFSEYPGMVRAIKTDSIKLSSISVTKQPTKISYTAKESFSSAGMEVKATFSNDAYKNVTGFTVTPSGALNPTDTKVKISYTEFGVTSEVEVPITVSAIKLNVPTQSGSPVYTGSSITATWSGYDSSLMTISGNTGVNAGQYLAVFSLKDKVNYTWSDGTTADKSIPWSIKKAQASITLDKTSVVLNPDTLSDTITFSSVGMDSVMVMSSDMSVATVSMDGNVITVNSVNETTGTANIIISGEVNSNYNAPEYPTIAISAEFVKIVEMILRPTSAGGAVSPSGMSAVEAMSEEVTDDSTYIYGTVKAASGTSSPMSYTTLNVAFNETEFAGKLISAYMIIRRGKEGVSIQSETTNAGAMMVAGTNGYTILPDTAANGYTDYQYTFGDAAIASINEYIITNSKLPSFIWQGQFGHNNPGGSMTVKVSQAYVVLIYEEPKEITFTINGTQYSAYETMTWNKWNDSDFNTSGQKVTSVTDASGNSVSLDSVIVGDTAYEVEFAQPVMITLKNYDQYFNGTITYNGVQQTATFTANIGDTIEITKVEVAINDPNATPTKTPYQMLNMSTSYTVVSDATFEGKSKFSGNTSTGMYYLLSIIENPCTVTIKSKFALYSGVTPNPFMDRIYVELNGQKYQPTTLSLEKHSDVATVIVPYGPVMHCCADSSIAPTMGGSKITVNDTIVVDTGSVTQLAEYDHVITNDIMVELQARGSTNGNIAIIAQMFLNIVDQPAYTVSVEVSLSNGYQKGNLLLTKSIAREGDVVTFTPSVTHDGAEYGGSSVNYLQDGQTKTVYLSRDETSFTMPAADVTLVANFYGGY